MQGPAAPALSTGSLAHVAAFAAHAAANDQQANPTININAILQVLEFKPMATKDGAQNTKPRYRVRLGDGAGALTVMLSTQMSELITNGQMVIGSIVEVADFIANNMGGKRAFIAINCNVLEQYGTYTQPIIYPPNTELVDIMNVTSQDDPTAPAAPHQQQPQQQQQQQAGGMYGGPPPQQGAYGGAPPPQGGGGMYGGPPPQQQGGGAYGGPPPQQGAYGGAPPPQGGGGMYGGPPPPANGGGAYGGPPPPQGAYGGAPPPQGGGGMYGGPPPPQQQYQQPGGGGMYGGPPPGQVGGYGGGGAGSRPPPQYQSHGPIARDEAAPRILPISSLNPYTARWAIRGRVTAKGELRRWTNVKGEGKVFSFDLLDLEGGEIRATAFGAEAEKFYELVEQGGVYQVTKASLTQKRPQYNHTNHAYEIKLDRGSVVERVAEDTDTASIPAVRYHFRRIADLEAAEAGSVVDVVGVVESCDAWQSITRRTGEETQKRSMVVRDDSGRSIEVTLWGPAVSNPGDQIEQAVRSGARPVLAAKALRVGDYNGKTLSSIGSSILRLDPADLPDAQRVRAWYDGGGRAQAVSALSSGGGGGGGKSDRRATFAAIKDERLGTSGKADWVTVSAVLDMVRIPDNPPGPSAVAYPGCPHDFNNRPCQKKMLDIGGGNWNCERCNYSTAEPSWRYMVNVSACDHTGKQALYAFGEAGDVIFGRTAAEVRVMESEDPQGFDRLTESIRFTPMIFRLKVAEETYNDEQRLKVSIYRLEKLTDYVKESGVMLSYIKALEAGQPVLTTGGPGGAAAAGAAAGAGGPGGGGGGYRGAAAPGGPGQQQFNAPPPAQGGYGGSMYGTAPATNPYAAAPPAGGPPPTTPPPAAGGGMYGGPPPAGGGPYQQPGGGSGGRGGPSGYGGAPPPQQQYGGYGSSGGYGAPPGGGGYGPPPTGGGGWNAGPAPQQQQHQQGGWNQGGQQGGYGGPPPPQQQQQYQQPPNGYW